MVLASQEGLAAVVGTLFVIDCLPLCLVGALLGGAAHLQPSPDFLDHTAALSVGVRG